MAPMNEVSSGSVTADLGGAERCTVRWLYTWLR